MSSQIKSADCRQQSAHRISRFLFAVPAQRSAGVRYAFAAATVTVAFGLRYLVSDDLINRVPFAFFIPAVLLAAWHGGFGPGLLAFLAGLLLGDYFFLEPHNSFGPLTPPGRLSVGIYTLTGLAGISLLELRHATNHALYQRVCGPQLRASAESGAAREEPAGSSACTPAPAEGLRSLVYGLLFTVPAGRSVVLRYAVAFAALLIGFALRYWTSDEIISRLAFMFLLPAIFFAIWYGGAGPGLAAVVGGLLLATYFVLPSHIGPFPATGTSQIAAVTFALTGLAWIAVLEMVYATHRKLKEKMSQLRSAPDAGRC